MPLGSHLGPSETVLDGLVPQMFLGKQNQCSLRFLQMQGSGTLRFLVAFLGASSPLLGRSDPKMVPPKITKSHPKKVRNINKQKNAIWGPLRTPKPCGSGTLLGEVFGPSWPKLA